MRKKLIFAAAAALLSLVSCQKEARIENETRTSPVFTASIAGATKTTIDVSDGKVAWEAADEITVTDAAKKSAVYKVKAIDPETGKATFVIKDGQTALGDGPYTATYGTEPAAAQTYSATAGRLHMTAPETSESSLTFTVQCGLMKLHLTKAGESVKSIAVTGTPAGKSETTYTLTCGQAESIASGKDFFVALPAGSYTRIEITNASDAVCTLKASGVAVDVNHIRPVTFGGDKLNFVGALVDLGLSVKWASCNLGAAKPENCGNYYQWGGKEDVSDQSIDLYVNHCPHHTESTVFDSGWLKYIPSDKSSYWSGTGSADNKTSLDPEDDAAHATLGGYWRMPTEAEWEELENNCTWEWVEVSGVHGYKVTGKAPGYTDRYIFLPAAGYRQATGLPELDKEGAYWSSSLDVDTPHQANYLRFTCDKHLENGAHPRHMGFSVRPVYDISPERPAGALPGVFSISSTRKVYFSKGNLWADGSNALHFENAQWMTTPNPDGEIDKNHVSHFTWSDNIADAVSDTNKGSHLFCDKNHMQSVDGSGAVYYTLSHDEWKYLLNKDDDDKSIRRNRFRYGVTVHGLTHCLVLAPDNWDYNAHPLQASYGTESSEENPMTWAQAEAAGLVCFPAAGFRLNARITSVGNRGFYWSSTVYDDKNAYMMNEDDLMVLTDNYNAYFEGCSIRLVADVKE